MKYIVIISAILLAFSSNGQTRRMTNPETGRSYSTQNQSQTVLPLLHLAEQQFRSFDLEESFLTLESAIAQNPFSPEALLLRARLKKMMGMTFEAELDYQLAHRMNPYVADLYGYNGNNGLLNILSIEIERSVLKLDTYQKLNYYHETLDKKTEVSNYTEQELELLTSVIEYIENQKLDEALDLVLEIAGSYPESAIVYDLKGLVFYKQDRLDEARTALLKATSIDPSFSIAWFNLGQIESSIGNYHLAKSYLDKAIELQDDLTKAYFERAVVHKAMGNKESALADYNTVISMHGKTYMEAYLNRGLTKKMLGDFNGAISDLNIAIEEYPNNADLRKNRGNIYLLFGMRRKAIEDYTKAIELDPGYSEAYFNRALSFFIQYDNLSGCSDLQKSIDLGYERAKEAQFFFCTE
jgi:tetratricopeptide (TPR) repeat protein